MGRRMFVVTKVTILELVLVPVLVEVGLAFNGLLLRLLLSLRTA